MWWGYIGCRTQKPMNINVTNSFCFVLDEEIRMCAPVTYCLVLQHFKFIIQHTFSSHNTRVF